VARVELSMDYRCAMTDAVLLSRRVPLNGFRTSSLETLSHRIDAASHNTKSRAVHNSAVAPPSERRRPHLTVEGAVRPWKGPGCPGEGLVSVAATSEPWL